VLPQTIVNIDTSVLFHTVVPDIAVNNITTATPFIFSGTSFQLGISLPPLYAFPSVLSPNPNANFTVSAYMRCNFTTTSATQGSCGSVFTATFNSSMFSNNSISATLTSSTSLNFISPISSGIVAFSLLFTINGSSSSQYSIWNTNHDSFILTSPGYSIVPGTGFSVDVVPQSTILTSPSISVTMYSTQILPVSIAIQEPLTDNFLPVYLFIQNVTLSSPCSGVQGLATAPLNSSGQFFSNGSNSSTVYLQAGSISGTFELNFVLIPSNSSLPTYSDSHHYQAPPSLLVYVIPQGYLVINSTCSSLTIGAQSCTISVSLSQMPRNGSVTANFDFLPLGHNAFISPSSVTFDSTNYDFPQNVTITSPLSYSVSSLFTLLSPSPQLNYNITLSGPSAGQYLIPSTTTTPNGYLPVVPALLGPVILSQIFLTNVPTALYVNQISSPILITFAGISQASITVSITSTVSYAFPTPNSQFILSGILTNQSFAIEAPNLNAFLLACGGVSSASLVVTFTLVLSGTNANLFNPIFSINGAFSSSNSFQVTILPIAPLYITNIPSTVYSGGGTP
jgi:hypothetical protein